MTATPNRSPVRRYYPDLPRPKRRLRTPMRPPIPCVIVDNEGTSIAYDHRQKIIDPNELTGTVFPSRSQARKALWHIIQQGDFLVYAPFKVVLVKT